MLAEIEERELHRKAEELMDEWVRERERDEREKRDAKFYLLGFRGGLATARRRQEGT